MHYNSIITFLTFALNGVEWLGTKSEK